VHSLACTGPPHTHRHRRRVTQCGRSGHR
jgi:hypothetical protein